jgi:5-methylcytosine-specific restriction endonuclease McrA
MKAKERSKLALKTKETQTNALEFLKRAIENQFTPESNDLMLYVSLRAIYKWVCPICLTPFETYYSFIMHLRYEEKETKCRYCGVTFVKPDHLIDHISKKHMWFPHGRNRSLK